MQTNTILDRETLANFYGIGKGVAVAGGNVHQARRAAAEALPAGALEEDWMIAREAAARGFRQE